MQSTEHAQNAQKQRLWAIGRVLVTRRVNFDPARHRDRPGWMETVRTHTNLSQTVISHLETGARDNYNEDTLTKLERVYQLRPGSLEGALKRGEDLVAADGEVLYPPPPPGAEQTRDRAIAREWHSEITSRAVGMALDLEASTEGMPEDVAKDMVRRAMAAAEAQAKLILETERRVRDESGDESENR